LTISDFGFVIEYWLMHPVFQSAIANLKSQIEKLMVPQIQPVDLKRLLDAGQSVVLLDVRQPEEHAHCALPGSVLIPLGELPARVNELDPAAELVVVYCHHGVRSLSGAAILAQAGFANVASLAGGIDRWSLAIDPSVPRY
jgi:rhodanese-related sulfurtransferase